MHARHDPFVILAIPTYRRPHGLGRLLEAVSRLDVPAECRFAVAVIDNAPSPEVRKIVEQSNRRFPYDLRYIWFPARGLSKVRNRALDHALAAGATHLGFIDDDEAPAPGWLCRHLEMQRSRLADASVGAVHAVYDTPAPHWLRRGGFLEMRHTENGARVPHAATSNVLFSLDPVRAHGLRFDTRYDFTGGEDTVFFDRYMALGGEVVFAARAIVEETIPAARASLGWLWRRWRRTGQTSAELVLARDPRALERLRCALGGVARIGVGGLIALISAPAAITGNPTWARGVRIVARGAGFLDTVAGQRTLEYAHPDR